MNLDDIPEAGPVFLFFVKFVLWLDPIIHALGLGIAVWAFKRSRKRGYIIVAFYFLLALFSLLAMPSIMSAIYTNRGPRISEQTEQKINAATQEAIDRVLKEEGHPVYLPEKRISFPLGPIVLVVGLWCIARRESHGHSA